MTAAGKGDRRGPCRPHLEGALDWGWEGSVSTEAESPFSSFSRWSGVETRDPTNQTIEGGWGWNVWISI